MSAVECKEPGFYKDFDERTDPGDDFGVETEQCEARDATVWGSFSTVNFDELCDELVVKKMMYIHFVTPSLTNDERYSFA